jgi:hypothetical protein
MGSLNVQTRLNCRAAKSASCGEVIIATAYERTSEIVLVHRNGLGAHIACGTTDGT